MHATSGEDLSLGKALESGGFDAIRGECGDGGVKRGKLTTGNDVLSPRDT